MTTRRNFVKLAGTVPFFHFGQDFLEGTMKEPAKKMSGPVIKSIQILTVAGSFNRFVGMNSYDNRPKGINKTQLIVLLTLADGTTGLSVVGYTRLTDDILSEIKNFISTDPYGYYQWENDKIIGVKSGMEKYFFDTNYSWIEGALLDAIGKLEQKPVWQLFGGSVREGIDTYDGSLYFDDIANNTDVQIIAQLGRKIKNEGYRAIKMKLGRPYKWLKGEAGMERDIEAFIALREAVGWNFNIMADANNGYRDHFDWAVKLLKSCAPYDMYWIEEIFPEDTQKYLKLREELFRDDIHIPIAEGETIKDLNKFDQYLEDKIYKYLQPDMRTSGMSNILRLAQKAKRFPGVQIIPHNWQSQLGLIMSMHASKVAKNITFVEDDRFSTHAFSTINYQFKSGQWHVPDEPGWGIQLIQDYEQFVKDKNIVIE